MKTSTIEWIDVNDKRPIGYGWHMVVLKPVNFNEFKEEYQYNDWIEQFGLQRVWFNNGHFWEEHMEIDDRVIYWAEIPSVPLFKVPNLCNHENLINTAYIRSTNDKPQTQFKCIDCGEYIWKDGIYF